MTNYTDEERDRLYDLIDSLPSQYFGGDESQAWEASILELAQIVSGKRTCSTCRWWDDTEYGRSFTEHQVKVCPCVYGDFGGVSDMPANGMTIRCAHDGPIYTGPSFGCVNWEPKLAPPEPSAGYDAVIEVSTGTLSQNDLPSWIVAGDEFMWAYALDGTQLQVKRFGTVR